MKPRVDILSYKCAKNYYNRTSLVQIYRWRCSDIILDTAYL